MEIVGFFRARTDRGLHLYFAGSREGIMLDTKDCTEFGWDRLVPGSLQSVEPEDVQALIVSKDDRRAFEFARRAMLNNNVSYYIFRRRA